MIITIDGPCATGKSTVARSLAEALGFIFFDTGAMYRSLTYAILKHQIDIHNPEMLQKFLLDFDLDIRHFRGQKHYFYEGEDISQKIRKREVTDSVSEVSADEEIRKKLVEMQRSLSEGINAVFEGRDMGSIVFPNAELKIFLTGRNDVRAKRRFDELKTKFPDESKDLTLEKCLEDLNKRDSYDSTREHSPLCQAPDAYVIDTSDLGIDEIVDQILEIKDSLKTKHNPSSSSNT